jgi:hypothetical protein
MKTEDVALHKEGTAEGYLGVEIQQHENQITFMQIGLTKRIIDALGLDSKFNTAVATPGEKAALGRDVGGPVVGRLDMYRTKVLLYHTMVLMARPTKVRR